MLPRTKARDGKMLLSQWTQNVMYFHDSYPPDMEIVLVCWCQEAIEGATYKT